MDTYWAAAYRGAWFTSRASICSQTLKIAIDRQSSGLQQVTTNKWLQSSTISSNSNSWGSFSCPLTERNLHWYLHQWYRDRYRSCNEFTFIVFGGGFTLHGPHSWAPLTSQMRRRRSARGRARCTRCPNAAMQEKKVGGLRVTNVIHQSRIPTPTPRTWSIEVKLIAL